MTCIVGLVHDGTVWIGGDSAGVSGWALTVRADEKVFTNGPFVMGFTSSFRMGQLLRYNLEVPRRTRRVSVDEFMHTVFVDAVRKTLKDGGYAKVESGREEGGDFLVGYAGRLFAVQSDFQVSRTRARFDAVGCGADVARGYLTAIAGTLPPEVACRRALRAAEQWSAGVRGPFRVVRGAR